MCGLVCRFFDIIYEVCVKYCSWPSYSINIVEIKTNINDVHQWYKYVLYKVFNAFASDYEQG